MTTEYRVKTFKSGNSLALRLPKGIGLADGDEMRVVAHQDGSFTMWKASSEAAVLASLFGSFSSGFMAEGRGDIEQTDRLWDMPGAHGHAA